MDLLIDCYLATSRVALQADCSDPSTWQEMHTLLPNLHEHLSCRICRKLVDQLNPHIDGFTCTVCVTDLQIGQGQYTPITSIIQCYKKLCSYIQKTQLYEVMCSRHEDNRLVELLTEVNGASRPVNGLNCLANGTTVNRQKHLEGEEADSHSNVISNAQCANDQLPAEDGSSNKHNISPDILKVESVNNRTQNKSVYNVLPRKKVCSFDIFLYFYFFTIHCFDRKTNGAVDVVMPRLLLVS